MAADGPDTVLVSGMTSIDRLVAGPASTLANACRLQDASALTALRYDFKEWIGRRICEHTGKCVRLAGCKCTCNYQNR